jgi:hypothetical protein
MSSPLSHNSIRIIEDTSRNIMWIHSFLPCRLYNSSLRNSPERASRNTDSISGISRSAEWLGTLYFLSFLIPDTELVLSGCSPLEPSVVGKNLVWRLLFCPCNSRISCYLTRCVPFRTMCFSSQRSIWNLIRRHVAHQSSRHWSKSFHVHPLPSILRTSWRVWTLSCWPWKNGMVEWLSSPTMKDLSPPSPKK